MAHTMLCSGIPTCTLCVTYWPADEQAVAVCKLWSPPCTTMVPIPKLHTPPSMIRCGLIAVHSGNAISRVANLLDSIAKSSSLQFEETAWKQRARCCTYWCALSAESGNNKTVMDSHLQNDTQWNRQSRFSICSQVVSGPAPRIMVCLEGHAVTAYFTIQSSTAMLDKRLLQKHLSKTLWSLTNADLELTILIGR